MFKKTKKTFSVLVVLAMVLSLFVGVASAATNVNFGSGYTTVTTGTNKTAGNVTVSENGTWANDIYVQVELPSGVTYNDTPVEADLADYVTVTGAVYAFDAASSNMLRIKLTPAGADSVTFRFNVADESKLDIASDVTGDIKATVNVYSIDAQGSVQWVESDTRIIAKVATKDVTVKAAATKTVQMGNDKTAAKITIQEGTAGSLIQGEKIRLEILTSGITFNSATDVTGLGSEYTPVNEISAVTNGGKWFNLEVDSATSVFTGKIDIVPSLNVSPTVTSGDVQIRVRGLSSDSEIPTTTLTVATVGTSAVEITGESYTDGTIYAGQVADVLSNGTGSARFSLKATGGSAIPAGKIVLLELAGARFESTPTFVIETRVGTGNWQVQTPGINPLEDGKGAWFTTAAWDGATEIRIRSFEVFAPSNTAAGDIKVTVGGNLGVTGEVVIGEVVKPFSVTANVVKVNFPGNDQAAGSIVITETAREAMKTGTLKLTLPTGVSFTSVPDVSVTEGDLQIDEDGVELDTNGALLIPVTGESSEASTITIDEVSYNVSRFALEGSVKVKVSLVEDGNDEWVDTKTIAEVINAGIGAISGTSVFTIGNASYTVDGRAYTMDVAPIIKESRTFLPLRFAAEAAGTQEIIWDQVRKTVTLIRGDRVVQVTIGSTTMLINGAAVTMDVAPEIVDGRTMLPIRWVGMALRADVEWNDTNKTVTVKPY